MARMGSSSNEQQLAADQDAVRERMHRIRHKILVLSGKGGVGKSTVAANLAVSLAQQGFRVGLLDIDIHGPSIPQLLGLRNTSAQGSGPGGSGEALLRPVAVSESFHFISIGSLIEDRNAALIWRGPMKHSIIKQMLKDVEWGDLDYLVVDSPPGTGDEPLSVVQLIEDASGAVVVTTPQDLAVADVRRCITFCRQLSLPVLGVVENMSGLVCPHCATHVNVFGRGGGERLAAEMGVPFLGRIPIDPQIVSASDEGTPYVKAFPDTVAGKAFREVCRRIAVSCTGQEPEPKKETTMIRIAIPLAEGKLALHFGHCQQFALVDVNPTTKTIGGVETVDAPAHEPGLLPRWLGERGAGMIIAGGMGQRAQGLFREQGIEVVVGATAEVPETLARQYLEGTLVIGANGCDH